MDDPTPPPHANELLDHVDQAIGEGIELEPDELQAILDFDSNEIEPLRAPSTSYFILGSYRSPYRYRLRSTAHELQKYGAYTVILGDVKQLETERLPDEDIMFTFLAVYSNYIAAIYEKDSGGEAPELGEIDDPPFFEKAYVYARDFDPASNPDLDLIVDTLHDYFDDQFTTAERERRLNERVNKSDSTLTANDVKEISTRRLDENEPPASYSSPHQNKFKKFNLHNRFHSWADSEQVPDLVVETIPGPTSEYK